MMQGDSYGLKFEILNADKVAIVPDDVVDVEITVGSLTKTFRDGKVQHLDGEWVFPLTQEETFMFPAMQAKVIVRVKWADGKVEGVRLDDVDIEESISRRVL